MISIFISLNGAKEAKFALVFPLCPLERGTEGVR